MAGSSWKLKGLRVNKRFIDRSDLTLRWEMEWRFIRRPLVRATTTHLVKRISCDIIVSHPPQKATNSPSLPAYGLRLMATLARPTSMSDPKKPPLTLAAFQITCYDKRTKKTWKFRFLPLRTLHIWLTFWVYGTCRATRTLSHKEDCEIIKKFVPWRLSGKKYIINLRALVT